MPQKCTLLNIKVVRQIIGNKYKFSAWEEVASIRKKGAFFYLI